MIVKADAMRTEIKERMRGGEGSARLTHMLEPDRVAHGRLLARIRLEPGSGIGTHEHAKETEYYCIVSGRGLVDEGQGEREVAAGDLVATGGGGRHSIRNPGPEALEFIAVIITD
jgi:mannose-6-phosphate isomerase-like protein (cupin superfamily)